MKENPPPLGKYWALAKQGESWFKERFLDAALIVVNNLSWLWFSEKVFPQDGDLLQLFPKPRLTSMKVAKLLACQWGTKSRQGSSFSFLVWAGVKLCPRRSESWSQDLLLPKKRFSPKSALTQPTLWTGPEGSTCSTSFHKRLPC